MKILHTADWHVGKMLHKQDLAQEIQLFFDWLVHLISEEKIDILLVSGDIFDHANPSHRDVEMYFSILKKLYEINVTTIITGGNHDSVTQLDSASALLNALNIKVFGGLKTPATDNLVYVAGKSEGDACVVLAVPFLRERDIRLSVPANEAQERSQVVPSAVRSIYSGLVQAATEKYGTNIPIIAMGHLYMRGSITSDSEREIHIGNLEGLEAEVIPGEITYTALGHIHKPQKVGGKPHIRYCGSPVLLDFSEKEYTKQVIIIETLPGDASPIIRELPVPKYRDMPKFTGTLQEVTSKLDTYKNVFQLTAVAEVEIREKSFDPIVHQVATDLGNKEWTGDIRVIKTRILYEDRQNTYGGPGFETLNIRELSPMDIFRKRLEETALEPQEKGHLEDLYNQLLETIQQS